MARALPHNVEAEQSILGALLIYPSVSKTVFEQALDESDFFMEHHRHIFASMMQLIEAGKPIDATTIVAKLQDSEQLALVGGAEYILALSDSAVTSANVNYYIEIVKDKADARRLIMISEAIAETGFDTNNSLEELLDDAESKILSITRNRRVTDFRSSRDIATSVMNEIDELQKSKEGITGIKTGYAEMDRMTNGLQRGDLIILAARPSVGKTAFALNLALRSALHNRKTSNGAIAVFSLEMPSEQLMKRILSAQSKVEGNKLRNGKLQNDETNRLYEAVNKIKDLKLFVDDTSSIRIGEVFSKCRKLASDQNGLDLVIVDYLQLIQGSGKRSNDNRQQEVSDISRSLKIMARDLNCPVIALSQLSRSVEQRAGDKRPMLSDLRESGSIEQDADIVLFLYREDYHNKSEEARSENAEKEVVPVEVLMEKHRNGATGSFTLQFEKKINAFYSDGEYYHDGGSKY
ncbi:MAG: replicative DNA helicase [Breznakia sp.]